MAKIREFQPQSQNYNEIITFVAQYDTAPFWPIMETKLDMLMIFPLVCRR